MLITFPEGVFLSTGCIEGISSDALSCGEQLGDRLLQGLQNIPRHISMLFLDKLSRITLILS